MEETDFDSYQKELRQREWKLEEIPYYEKGKRPDITKIHDLDWLDIKKKVYGRDFGQNGIGKLKEVALVKITQDEVFTDHPLYNKDPEFFLQTGLGDVDRPDTEKWAEQQENYAKILKENGVKVRWIEFPPEFLSFFGPVLAKPAANDCLITRGGSIIQKGGMYPIGEWGRFEFLARWFFWQLNIPVLLAITGKGVCEADPITHWLADDAAVFAMGSACNEEGLNQLLPAIERTSGIPEGEEFKAVVNHMSFDGYFDRETGIAAHIDMVLTPLDVGKVLLYPPAINSETFKWLRKNKFEIIDIGLKEQVEYLPANLTELEPGKVIMSEGPREAIAKVRKAGVDVIEVPYSECVRAHYGIHCSTNEVYRERGPLLREISK